jgi:hypothetical protein
MAESEKKKMVFQFLTENFVIYGVKGLGKSRRERMMMNLRSNSTEISSVILRRAVVVLWPGLKCD